MTPNRDAAIRAEAAGRIEFIEPAWDARTEWQYARSCASCRDEVHECAGGDCACGCESNTSRENPARFEGPNTHLSTLGAVTRQPEKPERVLSPEQVQLFTDYIEKDEK